MGQAEVLRPFSQPGPRRPASGARLAPTLGITNTHTRYRCQVDTELLKSSLPVVGGILALMGGVFTFVSGRLRDAADDEAKSRVLDFTWLWIAVAMWLVGQALTTFTALRLYAIPLYAASLAIHWWLFVRGPEPASRKEIAVFVMLCTVTGFAILFAIFTSFFDRFIELQNHQIELLQRTLDAIVKPTQ